LLDAGTQEFPEGNVLLSASIPGDHSGLPVPWTQPTAGQWFQDVLQRLAESPQTRISNFAGCSGWP